VALRYLAWIKVGHCHLLFESFVSSVTSEGIFVRIYVVAFDLQNGWMLNKDHTSYCKHFRHNFKRGITNTSVITLKESETFWKRI